MLSNIPISDQQNSTLPFLLYLTHPSHCPSPSPPTAPPPPLTLQWTTATCCGSESNHDFIDLHTLQTHTSQSVTAMSLPWLQLARKYQLVAVPPTAPHTCHPTATGWTGPAHIDGYPWQPWPYHLSTQHLPAEALQGGRQVVWPPKVQHLIIKLGGVVAPFGQVEHLCMRCGCGEGGGGIEAVTPVTSRTWP